MAPGDADYWKARALARGHEIANLQRRLFKARERAKAFDNRNVKEVRVAFNLLEEVQRKNTQLLAEKAQLTKRVQFLTRLKWWPLWIRKRADVKEWD